MTLLREIKKRARLVAPQVLAACTVLYFSYHAIQGERGFLAQLRLRQELAQATATQATLAKKRKYLEHRAALLEPDNLDPDMLEERARALLNYGRRDEVIILMPSLREGTR